MRSECKKAIIHSESIQIDQLIKWLGLAETGGQARSFVDARKVYVNGIIVMERRKKIFQNDIVSIDGEDYQIVIEDKLG